MESCRKSGRSLEGMSFHRTVVWELMFKKVLEAFNITTSIGTVFRIVLAIGQPPFALANTSTPQGPTSI